MDKVESKKILAIGLLIVIIVAALFMIFKLGNKGNNKSSKEQITEAEEKAISYFASLKSGYATDYNGIELLYDEDKITYDDLSVENILNTASRYAVDNLDVGVPSNTIEQLSLRGITQDKYTIYNAKAIREAIKKLFGIDWDNKSTNGELNFIYDYIYEKDYDVYLKRANNNKNNSYDSSSYSVDYKIVDSNKSGKDELKVTIAIAYVYEDGNELIYYSDKENSNEVYTKNIDEASIDDDKLDDFKKYVITLKKVNDTYTFKSIEKNK